MSSEAGTGEEARRLEILLRLGKEIASELNLERAIRLVTDAATELTCAAFGSFHYNERGRIGESVVRADDVASDPRYRDNPPQFGRPEGGEPVRSYLAVPVVSRSGEVVGGLFFGHPDAGRFSAEHEKLAVGVAAHAAIVIDNARLYREAQDEIERRKNLEVILRGDAAASEANASHREAETEQALARLRDTERNFRLLVQSVTDYAIYMLDPEGMVVSWNAGAERIKGYKAAEIVGNHYSQFFTPEDRRAGIPLNALRTAREKGRFESEGWRLRKDGSRFWALAVLDAVRDEEGHLLGFAKITRDITERREAQLQLDRAQAQLAQSQKMEAIGHLTGGVAHDFNNLLMIVKGQVQLMRLRAKDPKDLRALDAIEQAAASGASLTRQLLTFARRQQLERVSIDLSERLSAMRELLASSVGGAIRLEMSIAKDVWPVEIDPSEFELALVNIAVNARDAMPGGGTLRVKAENVSLDSRDLVPLTGDFVALSLADTGSGIAPDVLNKVFEPFFTTKEVGKGTGLGLSQVYGFARQSGGDVLIASEPGQGTTVTLYLPRSHAAAVPLPPPAKPAEEAVRGKGTILVVEDNPQVSDVSTLLLEQLGYHVVRADRPSAALDILNCLEGVVLVFTDIVMPGDMDGLRLAREIRNRYPEMPVLLATGYSSAAERVGLEFPIIRKPYDYNALGVAVKVALVRTSQRRATAGR